MKGLNQFFYVDDSYGNDETNAILVYINNENHVRIMLPNEEFEGYCFAQYQEDCEEGTANFLEQYDGDEMTEEEIVKILLSLEK